MDITIILTTNDAEKFKLFQKYYDNFGTLLDSKVFEQKNACISLNFDNEGVIKTIERKDILYNARFK